MPHMDWRLYVDFDKRYLRPSEVGHLQGDVSKAKKILGWEFKVDFKKLVKMMVDADIEIAKREKKLDEK